MGKEFKVSPGKTVTGNLSEALELAEKTGVLNVPEQALCLHIEGGNVEEVKRDGE